MADQQQTVQILIGLLPSNKVLMQVASEGKILSYVELDKAGALQISHQIADMANKLENTQ